MAAIRHTLKSFHVIFHLTWMVTQLEGIFWIQPGMNHIVACCDIVSFSAEELKAENNRVSSTGTLNDTTIENLADFQTFSSDSDPLSLPAGAVVLPLVRSLNFRPHHWYNVCITHQSDGENGLQRFCIPSRPCGCECDEQEDESGWLRILINATFKSQKIYLRLTSIFSADTILRVRYNVTLQSKIHYEVCNNLAPFSSDDDEEQYQASVRQCRREPPPVHAHQIPPNEEIQISQKDVNGLPFYMLISINLLDTKKYFGQEIGHKLDPVKINPDEEGNGENLKHWIVVPVPTPSMEAEQRSVSDWDEEDSKRICPLIDQLDCSVSKQCNRAPNRFDCYSTIIFLIFGVIKRIL